LTTPCAVLASIPSPRAEPPRSLTMTFAPAAASARAWARPRPRPAPVTSATLPFRIMAFFPSSAQFDRGSRPERQPQQRHHPVPGNPIGHGIIADPLHAERSGVGVREGVLGLTENRDLKGGAGLGQLTAQRVDMLDGRKRIPRSAIGRYFGLHRS